ncbi:hypothetical protein FFT09_03585 [Saccharomonospora piscinae]|uniref:hypothetical protein n=1 Tax=Saccharomonospora piscinae TaxID=687388 RepID=UPI001105F5C0|nr:hypothetical protein [Saccharomonospora piscinae]TLW94944.1 hypothetical protein FFT09_03585 [Saccharomonospora piscinae]
MAEASPDPLLDVARGDAALSRHLRNSLTLLRGKTEDPEFRHLVDDVLTGRRGLRDVAGSAAFARALNPLAEQGAEQYRALSDEERDELAALGERQFAELRERERAEAQRRGADGEHGPDDGDDDFGDRTYLR